MFPIRKGFAGALLVAALAAGCSKEAPPKPAAVADVTVMTVRAQDAPVVYEFVGQTQSSREVEIRARIEGFLEKRAYNEGTLVKEGQVLFLMDRKPFEATLQQARGELAQQQARQQVAAANLARVRPLAEKNAVSQRDLDDAVGNDKTTRAAVLSAQGAVRQAELNLSYATIASPLTGLSSFAKIQDGAYINPSNNFLTTVAQLDPIWVNFSVSENQFLRMRESSAKGEIRMPPGGDFEVEVVLADGSIFPSRGRISFADPSFSRETGTFLVRSTFANPQGILKPGQFVRVNVLGATRPNAILVPQRAVQQGAKSHFVWVLGKDGKAEQRTVVPADWIGDDWVISQGLRAGEQAVVDGAIRVSPGAALKASPHVPPKRAALAAKATTGALSPGETPKIEAPKTPESKVPAKEGAAPVFPARVLFAYKQVQLDDSAKATLAAVAAALKDGKEPIELTGYTDKKGSAEGNRRVARDRAVAVRDALLAAGIEEARIVIKRPMVVTGSGSDDEARRVDITPGPARAG